MSRKNSKTLKLNGLASKRKAAEKRQKQLDGLLKTLEGRK